MERAERSSGLTSSSPSEGVSLEGVHAEMTAITPDLFGYLPLPLHVKHDPTYAKRDFSINPGASGMVDILSWHI